MNTRNKGTLALFGMATFIVVNVWIIFHAVESTWLAVWLTGLFIIQFFFNTQLAILHVGFRTVAESMRELIDLLLKANDRAIAEQILQRLKTNGPVH